MLYHYDCSHDATQTKMQLFQNVLYLRSLYVNEPKKGGIISYISDRLCKGDPVSVSNPASLTKYLHT